MLHLETELMGTVRERAEDEAINVFARNLHDLLMAAPAGMRAIHSGSGRALRQWAGALEPGNGGTTFFNFLASHDGIGLNPARGILSKVEIVALVRDLALEGALVSYKNNPDGTTSPCEINVTYLDALNRQEDSDDTRLRRFLLAHAILLAFLGVPAIYIHSILGSRNDYDGVKAVGHNRAINRQKFDLQMIEEALVESNGLRHAIYTRLSQLIQLRTRQPAFHPDNAMELFDSDNALLVLKRYAPQHEDKGLLCVFNLSGKPSAQNCRRHGFFRM